MYQNIVAGYRYVLQQRVLATLDVHFGADSTVPMRTELNENIMNAAYLYAY